MARITEVLAEANQLSALEQAMRPMLPDDARRIRILAESPRPDPVPPSEPRLLSLATKHLANIHPLLLEALGKHQEGAEFHPSMFELLESADRQIPGPGIHSAVWLPTGRYHYPFHAYYEAILRPLRYIPAYLRVACTDSLFTRPVIQSAAGHLA